MDLMEIHDGELRLAQAPTPSPGKGEVLLEVAAAGVNRADLLQVAGQIRRPPARPSIRDWRLLAGSRRSDRG